MSTKHRERRAYVWGILTTALCGLSFKVLKSSNSQFEGLEGEILDETAQMLKVCTSKKIKWLPKIGQKFELELPDKTKIRITGKILEGTPENRLKRKII